MTVEAKSAPHAIIIGQGKTLDFIDGLTQRNDTPEEYVRQEIAKSIVREYRYAKADVSVEFTLRVGTRKPRADLIIFPSKAAHEQANARIIIECKAPSIKSADKKEGVGQLHSYMAVCPNVEYGMWANSIERFCYRRVVRAGNVIIEEVPDLPEFGRGEEEADRPRFDQLKPATSDALLFAFRRCHNYIAGNQGLQKPQAFWELLKLIFCKIHDERGDEIQFFAGATERHGVNGPLKVQKRIDALFAQVKADYPSIFRKADNIELKPVVLAYLVSQLQMYSLLESDIDVKGRAYEESRIALLRLARAIGAQRVDVEKFRGREHIEFDLGRDEAIYNILRLNAPARIAEVIRKNVVPALKAVAKHGLPPAFTDIKIAIATRYMSARAEYGTPSVDTVAVRAPLGEARRFAEAEVTNQQLVDASVVLVNDERLQVNLGGS